MTPDAPDDRPQAVDAVLPGRVGLVVRLVGVPGMRPALLDVLNRYADTLPIEEPGTEMFLVSVDPESTDLVWLHEWFADEEARHEHQRSSSFGRMLGEMEPLLASPPGVMRLDPVRLHLAHAVVSSSV